MRIRSRRDRATWSAPARRGGATATAPSASARDGYCRRNLRSREGRSREAEAEVLVAAAGFVPAAVRRPAAGRDVAPTAAPEHAVRAAWSPGWIVQRRRCVVAIHPPVLTPFPHIAVHVVKTPSVWRLLTHRMCFPAGVGTVPAVFGQPHRQLNTTSWSFRPDKRTPTRPQSAADTPRGTPAPGAVLRICGKTPTPRPN